MEHEQYLLELLKPLGVYDLRAGAVNRGELSVYGTALDRVFHQMEDIAREMSLVTAVDMGLEQIEAVLPYRPVSDSVENRRQALSALLRIGGDSFTRSAINDTLAGCGINARASEGTQPGYVEIMFPDVAGIPVQFESLRTIIEEILPCHLEVTYRFWYNTWGDLAEHLSTWGEAEAAGKTWYEMSTWKF